MYNGVHKISDRFFFFFFSLADFSLVKKFSSDFVSVVSIYERIYVEIKYK